MPFYIKDEDGDYCSCEWQHGDPWHDTEHFYYYTVKGLGKDEATSFDTVEDAIDALYSSYEAIENYTIVEEE